MTHNYIFIAILGLALSACSASPGSVSAGNKDQSATETKPPTKPSVPSTLSICSKLDLSDLDWPSAVDMDEREPFALALNISGSFEGDDGWENLTNNFDGQGLSLGLLNQCLGQGSLQPLLVQMSKQYTSQMKGIFSTANFNSMAAMLNQWQTTFVIEDVARSSMKLSNYGFSKLDDPKLVQDEIGFSPEMRLQANGTDKNQSSVTWAVANLYTGSNFKSDWGSQLTNLSGSSGYRSIQVSAALDLHVQALELYKTYGLTQLRSYLEMFDYVVQNGGISAVAQANILAQFKSNPSWNETQKLQAILTERLKYVKSAYVADVRARKQSIINGNGTVHGVHRDYGVEYCAVFADPMP